MNKKLSACLTAGVVAVGFFFQHVHAETFTYAVTIEQPALAVSITSTTGNTSVNTIIDRANPVINLDKYIAENTGNVDAYLEAKAKLTSKDGKALPKLNSSTLFPNSVDYAHLVLSDSDTGTEWRGILDSNYRFFDVMQGTSKNMSLDLKVHRDFSAVMDVQVEFTAKPI